MAPRRWQMSEPRRSMAEEGTAFWLAVGAFTALGAAAATGLHVLPAIVLAAAQFLVATFCWTRRRIAFAVSIGVGIALAIATFPFLFGGEETPMGALVDSLVISSGLLAAFFGMRAFRERKA